MFPTFSITSSSRALCRTAIQQALGRLMAKKRQVDEGEKHTDDDDKDRLRPGKREGRRHKGTT